MSTEENARPQSSSPASGAASAGASRLELARAVLDFISRCFYPAILVSVLILLWPSLSGLDLKKLVDRLQTAKAGDYEFTFGQAQDVGAEIAPLNGKVVELERALANLQADLKRVQEGGRVVAPSADQLKARALAEREFKANSDYTVLVFHRQDSQSREAGAKITAALLKSGYRASDTETDFSELKRVKPEPNVVFLTYTSRGEQVLSSIEESIKSAAPRIEVRRNPRPIDLRRGDVQVLAF